MRIYHQIMTCLVALVIGSYAHAVVTVGATADCDYDNIEAAVANAPALLPIVFVASDKTYTDDFTINKSVYIYGGYDSCADAKNNTLGNDFTVWRGSGSTPVKINAQNAAQSTIIIQQFNITNGLGQNGLGGGIDVQGKSTLLLYNSLVNENRSLANAGGINVSGSDARLKLIDSNVMFNEANGAGGGIQCKDSASVFVEGNSGVSNNTAGTAGGGIFARTQCAVVVHRGGNDDLVLNQSAGSISGNTAIRGGGIAINSGGHVTLNGERGYPARVSGNTAKYGGGVSIYDQGSTFTGFNASMDANTAEEYAGGFLVAEPGAIFTMRRSDDGHCHSPARCSSLSENKVTANGGYAAAGLIAEDSSALIAQTHINHNRADKDVVLSISGSSYVVLEGNIIYRNQPHNNGVVPNGLFGLANESGTFNFRYNTVANNINQATFDLTAETVNNLNIFNSIIFNLGVVLNQQDNTNNRIQSDCSVMHERDSLTGNVGFITTTNPNFVDASNDDFKLQPNAIAVDMCHERIEGAASMYTDMLGTPRGHDQPKQNELGPYDAGAYEMRSDLIFTSSFE